MDIESRIRQLQKAIEKQKMQKGMVADIKIVENLVNQEWQQDKIEKIRDDQQLQLTLQLKDGIIDGLPEELEKLEKIVDKKIEEGCRKPYFFGQE